MAFGLISADDKNKIASFGEEIVSVAQNDKTVTFTKSNGNTSTLRLPDDFCPKIEVIANGGVSAVATCGNLTTGLVTFGTHDDGTDTGIADTSCTLLLPDYGTWTVTLNHQCTTHTKVIEVTECKIYTCDFGIRFFSTVICEDISNFGSFAPKNILNYVNDSYFKKPLKVANEYLPTDSSIQPGESLVYYDYSDWENEWFIKGCKPCLLNRDGTVYCYLNPNDYTKKIDGTDADITSYDYLAMVEIPLIWTYDTVLIINNIRYRVTVISNIQFTTNFEALAHTRSDRTIAPVIYHAMYEGTLQTASSSSVPTQIFSRSNGTNILNYCYGNYDSNTSGERKLKYTIEQMNRNYAPSGEYMVSFWAHFTLFYRLSLIISSDMYLANRPALTRKGISLSANWFDTIGGTRIYYFPTGAFSKNTCGMFCEGLKLYDAKSKKWKKCQTVKLFHVDNLYGNVNKFINGVHLLIESDRKFKLEYRKYSSINSEEIVYREDMYNITGSEVLNREQGYWANQFDANWFASAISQTMTYSGRPYSIKKTKAITSCVGYSLSAVTDPPTSYALDTSAYYYTYPLIMNFIDDSHSGTNDLSEYCPKFIDSCFLVYFPS